MGTVNFSDIVLTPLARIATAGGDVLHALKSTDAGFAGFGEAYFSWVEAGAIKAWKRHNRMTMNLVVPVGRVRFVFHGTAEQGNAAFRIEEIGEDRYARITVPPGVWFGFQGMGKSRNLVLNLASICHDPTEVDRKTVADINFDWN